MSKRRFPLIWEHNGRALVGKGPMISFDPGVGPGRYAAALQALRASGKSTGFASFTFDPDEPGSVVVIPAVTDSGKIDDGGPMPRGVIIDDGVARWEEGIAEALTALNSGKVAKVVLSRTVEAEFDGEIPVMALITRLRRSQPDSYIFAIDGLIGASPELLTSLDSGVLESVTLAGTAGSPADLDTDKISEEHGYAADSVASALAGEVALETPRRTVLEFGEIRHLATIFRGSVTPGKTVLDIIERLHPTAAVAGSPQVPALELIKTIEIGSRGRYAGPVGWFDGEGNGEFAIALRCGLITGARATLHAGGGIVKGSTSEVELDETRLKLRPMLQALGLE